ncbi:hypothetical protein F4815DRAFT_62886 [Daldinia loculata]|nr:hypothetical protein F4815DRAFT_62886 [Daldinia loculata]
MEQDNRPIYFQLRQLTRFFPRFQWLYRAPANEAEDEEQLSHEQPLENEQQTGSEQQPCSLQTLLPNNISHEQFQEILDRYPSYIRDVYQRAEAERFHGIPNKLKGRQEPYIEKNDLIYLDQWMQKRGTPLTKKAHIHNRELIEKNSNANVRRVTLEAFREYGINKEVVAAMDILQAGLKGVGPSRASLLLSVAFPSNLPFFSRGLYRWTHWNEKSGWAQDFKWTTDKYHSILERVTSLIERLSIRDKRIQAIDVEKVAFVLEHESCISGS